MRRFFWVFGVLAAVSLLATACGGGDDTEDTGNAGTPVSNPTSVAVDLSKDDLGRSVTVPSNPQRIVAMSPTVVEMLYAVGVTPVGRPNSATFPSQATSVADFGTSYAPNYEVIAQMNPDLIIADAIIQATTIADLERLGKPVFALKVSSVDEVIRGLRVTGALVGKPEAGNTAATNLQKKLDDVVAKVPASGPSVLVLVSAAPGQFIAARSNSYLGSILDELGARNLAAGDPEQFRFPGFTDYSPERILEKNPDIILAVSIGGRPGTPTTAEALRSNAALSNLKAVKEGRLYELDEARYIQSAGPRLEQILDELPGALYPSVFNDTY